MQHMDSKECTGDRLNKTGPKEKRTKSFVTGKLAKLEEDHVVHFDKVNPMQLQMMKKSKDILTYIVENIYTDLPKLAQ